MAKRPVDREVAKIDKNQLQLELHRISESEKTRRLGILGLYVTIAIGVIAWAAVRITDKPPWLAFALALISAVSGLVIILMRRDKQEQGSIELRLKALSTNEAIVTEQTRSAEPGPHDQE